MKNYIFSNSSQLVSFDNTNFKGMKVTSNIYQNIDWVFCIPADGKLFINDNEHEVSSGDIVFIMYPISSNTEKEAVIISDPKLKDYYKRLIEAHENEKKANCAQCCDPCTCDKA